MSQRNSQEQELQQFEDGQWIQSEHAAQSLPRVDGGKQAWQFLSACFLVEALVWGMLFALAGRERRKLTNK